MNVGKVIGHLYCTVKDPQLTGQRILCVEPLGGREKPLWALDAVGAGAGETVLYCTGREASFAFLPQVVPCNAAIVGIVDEIREGESRSANRVRSRRRLAGMHDAEASEGR